MPLNVDDDEVVCFMAERSGGGAWVWEWESSEDGVVDIL